MRDQHDFCSLPTNLNIKRDYLLIEDYLPTKFEASWVKCVWVISCTRFRKIDIPNDRRTCGKQKYALLFQKGINLNTLFKRFTIKFFFLSYGKDLVYLMQTLVYVRHTYFPPVSDRMTPKSVCLWRHREHGDSNKRWRQRRFEPSQEMGVKMMIHLCKWQSVVGIYFIMICECAPSCKFYPKLRLASGFKLTKSTRTITLQDVQPYNVTSGLP